jgi:predicted O-methyltransferase YrrM
MGRRRRKARASLPRRKSVAVTYRSADSSRYRMNTRQPYRELEPLEQEVAVVDRALGALRDAGVLPHTTYDQRKLLAHRDAVREHFDVPWTAITPRMERLLYAISAIAQPKTIVAAGVFCGFTFIANAGAAVGPGACYQADQLIGVEIDPEEAARAERNVRRIDPTGVARIVADDAVAFVSRFPGPIDLLYLDADGAGGRGKGVYLDILEAAGDRSSTGGLILAHNSVNLADPLRHYLAFVRDAARFRESVNVIFDTEGLEVTVR